jgi:hypothetical protein
LYECLAGQPPVLGDTDLATAMSRLQRDAVPVRKLRPGVPRALDDLIARLLSRDADDRPRNAALVRDALVRLQGIEPAEDVTTVVTRDDTPDAGVARPGDAPRVASDDPTYPGGLVEIRSPKRYLVSIAILCTVAAVLAGAGVIFFHTGTGARLVRSAREAIDGRPSVTTVTPVTTIGPAPVIVSTGEFDPPPYGDGRENPAQTGFLTDGDPTTTWSTVCYTDRNLAPKPGVGLVLELSTSVQGHRLLVTSPTTGGWGADVYVSDTTHPTLDGWGAPVTSLRDVSPGTTTFDVSTGNGRYVLFFITELGDSVPPCQRPWQVRIGEISLS